MSGKKGFAAVTQLKKRTGEKRGGNDKQPLPFVRSSPDALALCAETWLESLRARNYSETTLEGRAFSLKFFMNWAAERDVTRAGEVTRPILEAYQRFLSRYEQPSRKKQADPATPLRRLSWSTQRERLGALRDWFRWLTRQNVILHNPASEIELPRMEQRLPTEGLSRDEVARLLAIPDTGDPLGLRDRAMLELFYATGLRRAELCRLECPDLNAERGTLTVRRGKGKKDRVVPVGARAAAWVARYEREVRTRLLLDTRTPTLFLTGYGEAFNPDVKSGNHSEEDAKHANARKEFIGNAALHGQMATVFAKLIVERKDYGVCAIVVPLRDKKGNTLPGITIEDCGRKMGLNGVDNGKIEFKLNCLNCKAIHFD